MILADLREELADLLNQGDVDAVDHVPETVNPPVAIISASEPYVQEVFDSKTFAHDYKINLSIRLVAESATNDDATDLLDDLIVKTLLALHGSWECDVSRPFLYEIAGYVFLATDVTISTTITIA